MPRDRVFLWIVRFLRDVGRGRIPSMSLARRVRRSRGFTLLEALLTVVIISIIGTVAFRGVNSFGKSLESQRSSQSQTVALDGTVDRMFSSANSSVSVFTPSSCGGTGSGDGVACSEVRFYGKDSSGGAHYWGFAWDSLSGKLTEYKNLSGPDVPLSSGVSVGSMSDVTDFKVIPTSATTWAALNSFSGVVSKENRLLGNSVDPNGRVVGGNRTMNVSIASGPQVREAILLSRDAVFSEDVVNFQIKTPNVSTSLSCSDPLCSFTFASSASASHSSQFTDLNFGQYVPYLGATTPWAATACTNAFGVTVATVGVGTGSGDAYSVSVTPKIYGTCTFTVANAAGVSTTETIIVGGSPGDSLTLLPSAVTLGSNQSAGFVVTETGPIVTRNYLVFPSGSGSGGFNSTCSPANVSVNPSTGVASTVGLASVAVNTTCTVAVYDSAYSLSNPYTSGLIAVETVNLVAPSSVPPIPVPKPPVVPVGIVPPGTGVTPPVDTGCLNTTVGRPGTSCTTPPPINIRPPVTPCTVDAAGFCTVIASRTSNVLSTRAFCTQPPPVAGYFYNYLTGTFTINYNTYSVGAFLGSSTLTVTLGPDGACGTGQLYAWTGSGNPSKVFNDSLLPDSTYP